MGEQQKKNKKTIKIGIAAVAAILLLTGTFLADMLGIGGGQERVVEIPAGAGVSQISQILHQEGIVKHPNVFYAFARMSGAPLFQQGKHTLHPSMSYGAICKKLTNPPDVQPEIKRVVIPEGYELRQIVDLLVENGLGEKEAFLREIAEGVFDYAFLSQIPQRENRLEGYLYPDTYLFSEEESEHQILDKMLLAFQQKVVPIYEAAGCEESLDEVLILASVIEREAANDQERPTVASVFTNRIAIGMKLESCATVQYILKERKDILSNADIAIDSPYNTYRYAGLPKGPIASPGLASIEAALYPAETEYLYFVATADGSQNLFSKTFEEHNQKISQTQN